MLIMYWDKVYMRFIKVFQSQTFRIIAIIFRFSIFYALSWPIRSLILAHEFIFKLLMFYCFLIVCQHFCICIIVCLLSCQCRQNEFIAQSLTPNRDVGDKYLTFQSLDARNLLRTNVHYNSLV